MATTSCTWGTVYACDTPTKQYDPNWVTMTDNTIISAKDAKDGTQNWYSRLAITTGSTSKLYRSTKLVVEVTTYGTFCNAHYNASRAYLSSEEYTKCPDILDVDPNFSSAYGPGEGLSSSKTLASSPVCTDTSGTTSSKTQGIANGTTFYFVFDTTKLKGNETYYLYLIRYTNTYAGYFRANVESITMHYEQTEALTAPTISTTSSVISGTTTSIKVAWGSVTNASSYDLTLKVGSTEIGSATKLGVTSYDCSVSNLSSYRGKEVTAYVKANGSGKYTNSSNRTKVVAKINSLPTISVSQSGTQVSSSSSVQFTVTSNDADSQTTELYYSLNGGTAKKFTSPLKIEKDDVSITSNSITFYAQDSLKEKSLITSPYTFSAVFAPVLQEDRITMGWSHVVSMNGDMDTLVKNATIKFVLSSGTVSTVKVYAHAASTSGAISNSSKVEINSSAINYNGDKDIVVTISKISESILTPGHYFKLSFKVFDAAGDGSGLCIIDTIKRRPKKPPLPTNISYHTDYLSESLGPYIGYFRNTVAVTADLPEKDVGCAKIAGIYIINSVDKESAGVICTSGINGIAVPLVKVNPGSTVTLNFKVVDELDQITTSSSFATLKRTMPLGKPNGAAAPSVSIKNLNPYSNTSSFVFTHVKITSSNSSSVNYDYKLKLLKQVDINITPTSVDSSTQELTISASHLKTLMEEAASTNKNTIYDNTAVIIYTVTDAFGLTYSEEVKFTVDFRQNPKFSSDAALNFRINHDIGQTKTWSNLSAISADGAMVNSNEYIMFQFPPAEDDNGEDDVVKYVIQLARKDVTKTTIPVISDSDYTDWVVLERSNLSLSSGGYYYYTHKASQYVKNEIFKFKIYAIDSTGLSSNGITSTYYLMGCRTVNPDFTVGDITVTRNDNQVDLKYNFKITDLGGSSTVTWDEQFYNLYKNFERTIDGYTPSAILKIEICPDQNFEDGTLTSWQPNSISKPYTGSLVNFADNQASFTGFNGDRVFMRFTLYVSYALDSTRTVNPLKGLAFLQTQKVFTYFGSVPTVSHRSHWVGINTNKKEDNEAFVVENYQNKQYVVFRGINPINAQDTYTITFDLLTGSISGATIDGGSW